MANKNRFDSQILQLKEALIELMKSVKAEHQKALMAIQNHDYSMSESVIETDQQIHITAEKLTNKTIWRIAANQTFGKDLRKFIGYLNIIRDLERISNYSKNISKFNLKYKPENGNINDLTKLMNQTLEMMELIITAITEENLNGAIAAAQKDKMIDENFKKAVFNSISLLKNNLKDDDLLEQYTAGVQQLKYVERLGDHLVNICEAIVYIIKGKFYDLSSLSIE